MDIVIIPLVKGVSISNDLATGDAVVSVAAALYKNDFLLYQLHAIDSSGVVTVFKADTFLYQGNPMANFSEKIITRLSLDDLSKMRFVGNEYRAKLVAPIFATDTTTVFYNANDWYLLIANMPDTAQVVEVSNFPAVQDVQLTGIVQSGAGFQEPVPVNVINDVDVNHVGTQPVHITNSSGFAVNLPVEVTNFPAAAAAQDVNVINPFIVTHLAEIGVSATAAIRNDSLKYAVHAVEGLTASDTIKSESEGV